MAEVITSVVTYTVGAKAVSTVAVGFLVKLIINEPCYRYVFDLDEDTTRV